MAILQVTSAIERDIFNQVKTNFNIGFDADANDPIYTIWKEVCFQADSKTLTDRYPFSLPIGDMVEWIDEREMEDLVMEDFSLTNKDYEKTIKIFRNEIEDDLLDMAMGRARELGQAAARHPQITLTALINEHMSGTASTYGNGFDSKALFSTTHAWASGYTTSQDNLRGSAVANAGKLDTTNGLANLQGAYTSLSSGFKNHKERVIVNRPNLLVVSASTFWAAAEFLGSRDLAQFARGTTDATYTRGTSNILNRLGLNLRMDPNLTSGYWYMAATGEAYSKPVLWQRRQGPRFAEQTTQASDSVFLRKEYRYGVDTRDAISPMFWFKVVGGDGT